MEGNSESPWDTPQQTQIRQRVLELIKQDSKCYLEPRYWSRFYNFEERGKEIPKGGHDMKYVDRLCKLAHSHILTVFTRTRDTIRREYPDQPALKTVALILDETSHHICLEKRDESFKSEFGIKIYFGYVENITTRIGKHVLPYGTEQSGLLDALWDSDREEIDEAIYTWLKLWSPEELKRRSIKETGNDEFPFVPGEHVREFTLGTVHQVLKHVVKTYRARNSRGSHDHEDMLSIFKLLKSYIKSELQEAEQKHEKEPALAVGDALVRSFWLSFWYCVLRCYYPNQLPWEEHSEGWRAIVIDQGQAYLEQFKAKYPRRHDNPAIKFPEVRNTSE